MPRWCWWLMLAMFLLGTGSCAARTATAAHMEVPTHIVIADDVPNDAWICVPMMEWMAVTPNTIRCMPVSTLRWMLRHQKKG